MAHDETTFEERRVASDGPPLEAQPVPKTAIDVAIARAGIRPVAGALGSARTLASSERPTSNAPFYLGVRHGG